MGLTIPCEEVVFQSILVRYWAWRKLHQC
jgi:hypothetical protein